MSEVPQSRLSPAAVLAFVLGASSLLLSLATALPALFVGVHALRVINRSDGRLRGHRLAIAGLALGALVSLLTVVGICVMVLLRATENSLDAGCKNNLRQLGEAVQNYSNHNNKRFPSGTVFNAALTPERRLSWEAALVPYLSSSSPGGKQWEKLAGELAYKEAWDATANAGLRRNVTPFLCPAFARDLTPDQVGLTSYVGIAGVGAEAAVLPLDDGNAGFFGYDRILHPEDISASLGALLMTVETRQDNGRWAAGGPATVRGLPLECERYLGKQAAFGGLHRNGANVLWADGSVRLVTEQIEPDLFRSEARIHRP
jgi:prepilin-type processing-associated H-X9-DG protein